MLTVAAIIVTTLLMTLVLSNRASHTRQARDNTGPALRLSQDLYSSLAAADTAAANAFVAGGVEPENERERYDKAVSNSTAILADLSTKNPSPKTKEALDRIGRNLPRYIGLVETARANNRQGYPVGAAYMRGASQLMQTSILADARAAYDDADVRLEATYSSGGSFVAPIGLALMAIIVLGLMVYLQAFLLRRTNRVFNKGLLAATAVAVLVFCYLFLSLANQGSHLDTACTRGSDSVVALAEVRFEGLEARKDEGLMLIARGGGKEYEERHQEAMNKVGATTQPSSLLAKASRQIDLTAIDAQVTEYRVAHQKVRAADDSGKPAEAAKISLGESSTAFVAIDGTLAKAIGEAQERFDTSAAAAAATARWLTLVIALGMLVTAGLSLVGVQERMQDYR